MLLKLFRSIVIGLIVAGLLLVAMPSLRQFNKLSAPQFDSTDETPATYNQAVRRAAPAVVNVYNRGLNSSAHNQLEIRTLGSGVIMDDRGYIITNKHVINDADQIIVALQDGRVFEALLVGSDSLTDLAVLKINAEEALPFAEFGNSDALSVGDPVYAIGTPLDIEMGGTFTDGIVSSVNREIQLTSRTSMPLIQTNAALNNGNSGGPLINEYGQVIGINTLKMSTTDSTEATVEGLGFALPISSVSFVVNDLIANGHYRGAPSLGITVTTVERDGGGTQVQVMEVSAGSGAADAGIQAGDVILAADGQAVSVTSDLLTARDTVTLTILRDGQQFDVEVTLRSNRSFG